MKLMRRVLGHLLLHSFVPSPAHSLTPVLIGKKFSFMEFISEFQPSLVEHFRLWNLFPSFNPLCAEHFCL